MGAVGWIAGLVNALPVESVRVFELARDGRMDEARALYEWFLPLLRLDTVPKFVQLIKLVQTEVGQGNAVVRAAAIGARGRGAATGARADPRTARVPARVTAQERRRRPTTAIYAVVRKVPRGRVTTYGDDRAPRRSRRTRRAWSATRSADCETERQFRGTASINARGSLSLERVGSASGFTQRLRLQREGVFVNAAGRVSLERFGWRASVVVYLKIPKCPSTYQRMMKMRTVLKQPPPSFFAP